MLFRYVAGENTLIQNVSKLSPGHWMKIDEEGHVTEKPYYSLNNLKTMSSENNLEKSSQDYKKSQYGSWYKKSAENKKKAPDPQENSFINRLKKLFKK